MASSIVHHVDLDLKKWLQLVKGLRLIPPIANVDVSSLFLQKFEGHVTILPSANLVNDLRWILDEPTPERLDYCIRAGESQTWPKISIIHNRLRIEKAIKKWRTYLTRGGLTDSMHISNGSLLNSLHDLHDDDE